MPGMMIMKNLLANWISLPNRHKNQYGIYLFRKILQLDAKPKKFPIHISADNQYRLYLNEQLICAGPLRSDPDNWYYDSIDLAIYLTAGENIFAVQVWNMGPYSAGSQCSLQTGFFLQGLRKYAIATDQSWKVMESTAYSACSVDNRERLRAYMVVGPGEAVDAELFPWNWTSLTFDDGEWKNAEVIFNRWTLKPRPIPMFKERILRFAKIRAVEGLQLDPGTDGTENGSFTIMVPPYAQVRILFDQSHHALSYPELIVSKGRHAKIRLTYAESLFDEQGKKGNRDEIEGKYLIGNYDIFIADGGAHRKFRPLSIRTYRYLQIEIWTQAEALHIEDGYGRQSGYPMRLKAQFDSSDASLQDIWKLGWRTLQNCAGDSFYDSPYYEQLQYTADSRIQALVMLYTAGDDRLMRKCILDFYHSRTADGLTQSRYPSNKFQVIPAFSLFWISMIYDYWMHRKDDEFIQQLLPRVSKILLWFADRIDKQKKMLGPLSYWNFVDWDNFNSWGTAPGAADGNSSIITLQLCYTLNQAAELFRAFGEKKKARQYAKQAKELGKSTYYFCYDRTREAVADTPDKKSFSQHANIWAILSTAVKGKAAQQLMRKILTDQSIAQVTYFYRFYLNQALKKAGMAEAYYSLLGPWREMLALGLTTFAEKPEPTRSDCHGWSASPSYDFLATILGIMPGSPGFATVLIQPALGELTKAAGRIHHPRGFIQVSFKRKGKDGLSASLTLPKHLTGTLIWQQTRIPLVPGKQHHDIGP